MIIIMHFGNAKCYFEKFYYNGTNFPFNFKVVVDYGIKEKFMNYVNSTYSEGFVKINGYYFVIIIRIITTLFSPIFQPKVCRFENRELYILLQMHKMQRSIKLSSAVSGDFIVYLLCLHVSEHDQLVNSLFLIGSQIQCGKNIAEKLYVLFVS